MKRLYKTILLVLAQSVMAQGNWQQIWSDEFDYSGLPNSEKWSYDEGCGVTNNEAQYYAKERVENTRVENGNLIIEAHKEAMNGCQYTSGRIKSQYKGDWQYGKFEVRAKIPTFKGSWPAIWFLPTDSEYGGWPKSGEIDLLENVGYEPNKAYFTIHTEAYNHQIHTQKGANTSITNLNADFHTYTLEWYADSMSMFLDNVKYFTFKKEANDYKKWPFDKPFHLLLNLAIGGDWGGAQGIDDTQFPTQYLIDYVRVYQWQTSSGPYTLNIANTIKGVATQTPDKNTYNSGDQVSLTAIGALGYVFKGWSSDFFSSSNPLALTMTRDLSIKPIFSKLGELILNSDFGLKSRFWKFNNSGTAVATSSYLEGSTVVDVSVSNPNSPWDVQLSQTDINLIKNHTYLFSFEADANQSMAINAGIGLNASPWTSYGSGSFTVASNKTTFTKTFTMPVDDQKARVYFDMGKNIGKISLYNISLVDITEASSVNDDQSTEMFTINYNTQSQKIELSAVGELKSVQLINLSGKVLYEANDIEVSEISIPSQEKLLIIKAIDKTGERILVKKIALP